ncbi:MAG TPA: aquaporin [Micromonosporaceae bacterium]
MRRPSRVPPSPQCRSGPVHGLGGAARIESGYSVLVGLVAEALAAFLLVMAYYALVVEEHTSRGVAGLGVGLAYGAAILGLAPITGASANFARTLGTDVSLAVGGGDAAWGDLWIYAVGPLVGGLVAIYVYDVLVAGKPLMAPTTRPVTPTAGPAAAHPA